MAFSFANAASGASGFGSSPAVNGGPNVKDGPELQEIQTNELGFGALNGESKVRLLPTPWPSENLPPPSSSLLSIASVKGLLAAAGPDALYITPTDKVRAAFQSPPPEKDENTRTYTPEIKISLPRLSHIAFSSDDSVLVVSTEKEGGILAFQVDRVVNGEHDPAVRVSTNGQSLRALVPNPVPESAEYFALITSNGDLMLLDLKAGSLVSGSNGPVLASGASCLSWSNRGKQLVVGMADGTATQMKPDGTVVAQIPKSTSIPSSMHVSGISWLENDIFLIIYTPNDITDGIQPSEYYIVNREPKTSNYTFQKLPEVLAPFGVERLPSSHFISRLRNFPPHLQDLLIVSATTSTDIGLVSKADKPLSQVDQVTSSFTFTTIEDDTRRAQLPLSPDQQDTSPIGMALDLSSKDKVPNPIPSDEEILETEGPVPGLVILNNEGILVAWWIIYNDSVRQKTSYSGLATILAAKQSTSQPAHSPSPAPSTSASNPPANANAFLKPATSSFGAPAPQSGFGTTAKPFGTATPITSDKPSWASTGFGAGGNAPASTPAFGKPAFGSATPIGGGGAPAFGSASALGGGASPFGKPSTVGSTPAFGQPSPFGSASAASPFASAGGTSNAASGFASFANAGGFSSFAGGKSDQNKQSPFGAATGKSTFGQSSGSAFGTNKTEPSPFGAAKPAEGQSSFGTAQPFKVASSFQSDGTAKDDLPKPKEPSGFGFGSAFGDMLGESKSALSPTHDKEAEMDEESAVSEVESERSQGRAPGTSLPGSTSRPSPQPPQTLVTPPATLIQSKVTPAPPVSGLFGQTQNETVTPQPQTSTPGWSFEPLSSTTPKETPAPAHMAMFGTKPVADVTPALVQSSEAADMLEQTPRIKEEPPSDEESVDMKNIPEAPLPPDPESKPRYVSGDTSASSNLSNTPPDDAPLPPDFLPTSKKVDDQQQQQALPGDDDDDDEHEDADDDEFSSDFEGSDEDVTGDAGPEEDAREDHNEELQTSPESSFKSGDRSPEVSPTGGLFTKVSSTAMSQKPARPLFGEVSSGPVFTPPQPHESPRSPSPVRNLLPAKGLRVDPSRSVSAPAHPRSVVDQRKAEYQQSALAAQAAKAREEEAAREHARREALTRQKAKEEAEQLQPLEDDEDEILRQELERPISPTQDLDDFITYQPKPSEETAKTGIPAQIERLYSDINSMVYTLGINCRSLSAFMQYQQPEATNKSWPSVLTSESPLDILNDEWFLTDIVRLHEGQRTLSTLLDECQVDDFDGKIQQCQALIGRDLFELRTKLTSIRRTIHALSTSDSAVTAPLSAEQSSIQHDLRKAFTAVQTKLVQVEDSISVLRAKVAQSTATETVKRRNSLLVRSSSQKKPTVEAVTKTVTKMMSMAEQKSADIDVLEAQLKKLDLSLSSSTLSNGDTPKGSTNAQTPVRGRRSVNGTTPGSAGSVYHTPDSNFGNSVRSNKSFRTSRNGGLLLISAEDKTRWQAQTRRRKEAASMLKGILEEKRKRAEVKG